MRNYYIYFALTALAPGSALYYVGLEIYHNSPFYRMGIGYSLLYLGLLQLATGLMLLVNTDRFPDWAQKGIRNYSLFTIGFFANGFLYYGLLSMPFPILGIGHLIVLVGLPIYQFILVCRLASLRKRQLEKRTFLQIYSH